MMLEIITMNLKKYDIQFILPTNDSVYKRGGIFTLTIAIWWLSEHFLRPLCGGIIQDLRDSFGNGPFVQNVISQSLPVDIMCLILFIVFFRAKIIPLPRIIEKLGVIFREGVFWGLLICVPTIVLALNMGFHLGFAPNWQSILGNIISNSYEEFTYRVFLFSIAAYTFRRVWIGILISALLFASIHTQYPLSMQIIVALAAIFFSLAYIRSNSILSALLAHELSDAILDTILLR